jgi:hypothetical protein
LINGEDLSGKITVSGDTQIRLKAKQKRLGLVTGDNTIQVITSDDVGSNVFIIRL